MYSLDSLMHDLNIKNYPSAWEDILDEAVNAYKELDVLKDSYIDYLNNKYDAFPKYYDLLKKAAAEIRSNEKLAVFTSLLCIAMRDRENIANQLDELDLPTAQDGECTVGYDLCAIFPFLQFADDMASYLEKRDVPKDVIVSTIREFEDFISEGTPMYDRPLMNKIYLVWGQLFIDHKIIRIERFNLEFCDECHMHAKVFRDSKGEIITLVDNLRIHKSGYALGSAGYEDENGSYHAMITETDTYYEGYPANSDGTCSVEKIRLSKSDWSCVLSHSDKTISVHIPSFERFDPEYCTYSLEYADKILKKHFSDFDFKAYTCHSWFLEPQLDELLSPSSKIISFKNRFTVVPTISDDKAVFDNAFDRLPVTDYNELKPKTGLERSIKAHYLAGKHLYEYSGYFFL